MQKSGIEWTDYTSNPIKGYCPMACPYCYARKIYDRFKWDKAIRFVPEELETWRRAKSGSKIFVGSMIELFGNWVKDDWLEEIFKYTKCHPDLTFQFLTKQPQNLIKWSPFPDNCWVGVTVTNDLSYGQALQWLNRIEASIRYLSFEPLLEPPAVIHLTYGEVINWVIIGAQTKPYKPPKLEWVQEIIRAADGSGIPVFLKDNLRPLLIPEDCRRPNYLMDNIFWASEKATLRQELPEEVK